MEPGLTALDKWIKWSSEYGASWVFMVVVLGILVYATVSAIGILKKWVPRWFEAKMASDKRIADRVDRMCDTIECVHDESHAVRAAASHVVDMAAAYNKRAKEPWPSDVMIHLTNARKAFDSKGGDHVHGQS